MSSCALNWLQTIIRTLQNCWTPGPNHPGKENNCLQHIGELGPEFALVCDFFLQTFWPGESEH